VRQAVNRLEDAGCVHYDDGLSVVDDRVRDATRDLVAASAAISPLAIDEAYVLPQFGDWPFAFTRIDVVYVWTQGGYQVGREPDDYPLFVSRTSTPGGVLRLVRPPTAFERQLRDERSRSSQKPTEPSAG